MNGPSGNRDLGNLWPTIDNDDGSAYFSAEVRMAEERHYTGSGCGRARGKEAKRERQSTACTIARSCVQLKKEKKQSPREYVDSC